MAKDALWTLEYGDILKEDPTALNHVPHKEGDINTVIDNQRDVLKRLLTMRGIDPEELDEAGAETLRAMHLYQVMTWIYRRARREAKDRWDMLARDYEGQLAAMLDRLPIKVKTSGATPGTEEVTGEIRVLR